MSEINFARMLKELGETNAMYSIAAYAMFYWARGLNRAQWNAANDHQWRQAA